MSLSGMIVQPRHAAKKKRYRTSLVWRGLVFGVPLAIYITLSLVFFSHTTSWTQSFLTYKIGNSYPYMGDPLAFIWFLNWWPFAIAHHLNPLISTYVWYPKGFNFTWATTVPSAALLGAPLTLFSGPVLTYNFWSVMAPALSAWTAFFLAWYLTRDWAAALVGGYLFGFSSYELGQLLAHPVINLVFLVPIAVLLCVRRTRGEIGRWKFIGALTVVLLVEFGLSTEIVATLCVLGAITWGIFLLFGPPSDRSALWQLAVDITLAAGITIVLASPFLFYVIRGLPDVPPVINPPMLYSADAINYIVPTRVTRFGRTIFASVADHFTGNITEQGAYLGLPLILLLVFYFRGQIANRNTRALLLTICMLALLSLGPWLHIGGTKTPVPLPWLLTERLPLLRLALPTRFTMYVALAASVAAALYLASGTGRRRLLRFALAGLACLSLLPNVSVFAWKRWPVQPFFTPQNVEQKLGKLPNVLVLPTAGIPLSLAWQLNAGMRYTQSGGYVGWVPYREWNSIGLLYSELRTGAGRWFANDLTAFCATHHVNYIIMAPGTPSSVIEAVSKLKWPQSIEQGVVITQVPPSTQLQYSYYIDGEYWSSPQTFNWVGERAIIHNRDRPINLTLSGQWRPTKEPVDITLTDGRDTSVYRITQSDRKMITIKPNATVVLVASSTFHVDNDIRRFSVAISLRQPEDVTGHPK